MAGPAPQERKHGRTPNSTTHSSDWREYDDVPYTGGPAIPKPPGRRKGWHPMAEELWETASVMPHCKDWRPEDWLALKTLIIEVDRYYHAPDNPKFKTTAQQTEIRRQKAALGIGEAARVALRIRYRQKVEPGLPGHGPDGAREVVDGETQASGGNVVSIKDRKKAITSRGAGDSSSATG